MYICVYVRVEIPPSPELFQFFFSPPLGDFVGPQTGIAATRDPTPKTRKKNKNTTEKKRKSKKWREEKIKHYGKLN